MWEPVEQPEGGRGEILYRATLYEYDSESNKIREKRGLDKVGARQTPKRTHEIRFGYDALNRLVSVEDSHGARAEYRYNSLGRRTYESFRISGDVNRVIRYEYDALGNLTEKQEGIEERFQKPGGKKRTVWAVTRYEYDLNGNCVRKSGEKYQNEYTYDRMNRLVGAVQDGKEEKYAYDLVGNRLKKESVQGTESYHYNAKNQLTHIHNGENTLRYLYDKQGNLLEEQGKTRRKQYSYDAANRQVSIASAEADGAIGKLLQSNRYDGEGLRYETEEDDKIIRFLFDRGEMAQENREGEETCYVRGRSPIVLNRGGKDRNYFIQDEMGSTLFLLDQDHEIRKSYRYDAFGNILEETGDIPNRLMYTGQMYDGAAVQYYLRARFYNPAIGRFMQEDTYRGDGLNLYAYCANNPVMYFDPSGYMELCTIAKMDPEEYDPDNLIKNKFPDEAMPSNGKKLDYYIEDGKIKGINGLRDLDFVITKDGELIIGSKHHYLGEGQDVLAAGQLRLNGSGQIKRIDNLSGHYRPTVQESMLYQSYFTSLGLNMENIRLQYYNIRVDGMGFVIGEPILEYNRHLRGN